MAEKTPNGTPALVEKTFVDPESGETAKASVLVTVLPDPSPDPGFVYVNCGGLVQLVEASRIKVV